MMRINPNTRWALIPSLMVFLLGALVSIVHPQTSPLMKYESSREPWVLRANSASFDKTTNTYTAEGEVEISHGTQKLTADRVVLNAATQEADATGNVTLAQGQDTLRSEKMMIDMDTSLGIVIKGTLFLKAQNYHLYGEEIERVGEDTYRVKGGTFTTCNGDRPAWRFTGTEAVIVLQEYADIYGATFQIKNLPVVYSPYLVLPLKSERQSGFLFPKVGYSNRSGYNLGMSYFWAIDRNMDATFYLDLATQKGIGEGMEYRYIRNKDSLGSFYAYHLKETDTYRQKYTDKLDRKPDRWQIDYRHEEYFNPTFFAKTRLRQFSDRQYFVDYGSTYGIQSSEQAYSFLSLTKNWERFSFFGEGRRTVDLRQEDKTTLQYYPLTDFVGIRQPLLSSPLFFNFDSSYGYFSREQGTTGHRVDLFPRVSLPLKWEGIEFNTELSGRETWYARINGEDQSTSRQLWSFQTGAGSDFYRVYDTGSATLPRIKHVLRPEVSYQYIPSVDQSNIPYFDQPVSNRNSIFYGFTNRVIAKVVQGSTSRYHEYVYFKIGQAYNFTEPVPPVGIPNPPTPNHFSVITEELRIRGQKYIGLDNIINYDPNTNTVQTSYTSLWLADWRGDGMSLEHVFRKGVEEQLNGSLRAKILSSVTFVYGKRYSLFSQQTLGTSYTFLYRHQCWGLDVAYTDNPSIAGAPAEKKIMFMFNLTGVASIGQK
jgi:LPS-assembly protein